MPWLSGSKLAELQNAMAQMLALNEELQAKLDASIKANEQLSKRAFLMDIQRDGKLNKFMFVRDKQFHMVETMGLLSDNVNEWKEQLL